MNIKLFKFINLIIFKYFKSLKIQMGFLFPA